MVLQSAGPLNAAHVNVELAESSLYNAALVSVLLRAAANVRGSPAWNTLALRPSAITSRNIGWSLQTIGVRDAIASNIVSGNPSGNSLRLGTTTTSALAIMSRTSVFGIRPMNESRSDTPSDSPSASIAGTSPPPAS